MEERSAFLARETSFVIPPSRPSNPPPCTPHLSVAWGLLCIKWIFCVDLQSLQAASWLDMSPQLQSGQCPVMTTCSRTCFPDHG